MLYQGLTLGNARVPGCVSGVCPSVTAEGGDSMLHKRMFQHHTVVDEESATAAKGGDSMLHKNKFKQHTVADEEGQERQFVEKTGSRGNGTSLCTPVPELQLPNDLGKGHIAGYRLGDFVRHTEQRWLRGFSYHLVTWPHSLASMYIRATRKECQYPVLMDCIHLKYAVAKSKLQHASMMVLHLRLGDVLDSKPRQHVPVTEFLSRWVKDPSTGGFYVPPLSAYLDLNIPAGVQRLVLMGNPHYRVGSNNPKSVAYASAIAERLKKLHPEVDISFRFSEPTHNKVDEAEQADSDLFFVESQAATFVPTGGGFSGLLAEVAKLAGYAVDFSIRKQRPQQPLCLKQQKE